MGETITSVRLKRSLFSSMGARGNCCRWAQPVCHSARAFRELGPPIRRPGTKDQKAPPAQEDPGRVARVEVVEDLRVAICGNRGSARPDCHGNAIPHM